MYLIRYLPWFMWASTTLFFAYQFIIRLAPGLVINEFMQKFQIDATFYGLFASVYYYGYAGMQIPIALLLNRFGARKVVSLSAFVCSLATIILVLTDNWLAALISRFLIGSASAAGFLGVSKIISLWFLKKEYTKMVGLTFTFGLLGALYGGKPVNYLILTFGWENVIFSIGLVGLGLAGLLAIILRDPQERVVVEIDNNNSFQLSQIVKMPRIIILAIANLLMVGALEGFADVWGVNYLMISKGVDKSTASAMVSMIFFGMIFGGPILAYLSHKFKSAYNVTIVCGLSLGIIFLIILFNSSLKHFWIYLLFYLTGILCCYQVLIFSIGVSLVSQNLSAVVVAFLNCINMLGGAFFHTLIGKCLDLFWDGQIRNDIPFYNAENFTFALLVIPIASIIGGMSILLIKSRIKN